MSPLYSVTFVFTYYSPDPMALVPSAVREVRVCETSEERNVLGHANA